MGHSGMLPGHELGEVDEGGSPAARVTH